MKDEKFSPNPLVSYVIPTFNSERMLDACLKSIFEQDYRPFEVIIIDGGSTDGTRKIAEKYDTKFIPLDKNIVGNSRQVGVENSNGEIIAFVDSDCIHPTRDWLSKMVERFLFERANDPRVIGVWTLGKYDRSLPPHLRYSILTGARKPPIKTTKEQPFPVGTGHTLITKKAIIEVGGFRRDLYYWEDIELTERLLNHGYALVYVPELKMWHYHTDDFIHLLKKQAFVARSILRQSQKPVFRIGFLLAPLRWRSWFTYAIKNYRTDRDWVWLCYPFITFFERLIFLWHVLQHNCQLEPCNSL